MPLHKVPAEIHGGISAGYFHDRADVPVFLKKHLSAFVRFPESVTAGGQVKTHLSQRHEDQNMPRVANRPPGRMTKFERLFSNHPMDGEDQVELEVGADWTHTVGLGPLSGWAPRQSGRAEIALL